MSDYLTRLIARSNGSETVVRPQLTLHYAPRDEVELAPTASDVAVPVREPDEQRAHAAPRKVDEFARTLDRVPTRPSVEHSPDAESASTARAKAPDADRQAQQRGRTTSADPASAPLQRTRRPIDRHQDRTERLPDRSVRETVTGGLDAQADSRGPVRNADAGSTSDPPDHRSDPPGTAPPVPVRDLGAAPVVRITIGRIEVRANVPRSAASAAADGRGAVPPRRLSIEPKLTLEEYLQPREAPR